MIKDAFLYTDELILIDKDSTPELVIQDIFYQIDKVVSYVTGFSVDALRVKDRRWKQCQARQIWMYFYIKAGSGVKNAGAKFFRDHSTASHAIVKIEQLYGQKCEQSLTEMVDKISELTGINLN